MTSTAQVKIGIPAGAADASAVLDASNTGGGNKGFLAPQVALTALNVAGPVTAPATGLLVYNTATAGTSPNNVVPGFYSWNGTQWVMIITAGSSTTGGNIYSNDGTLAGNRTVTMNGSALNFSGGPIGLGVAAPTAPLQFSNTTGNRKIVLYDAFNTAHQFYGFGVNPNELRYQVDNTGSNHIFYAAVDGTTSTELMRIMGNGRVGVGTNAPSTTLDVNGSARIRTVVTATAGTAISPLFVNGTGNVVKSPSTSSSSPSIASGATGTLTTNFVDGGNYRAVVITGDACGDEALAEYYIITNSANSYFAINGLGGVLASGVTNKSPGFIQTNRNVIGVTWTGKPGCAGGDAPTSLNYTLTLSLAGSTFTLAVTNVATLQRVTPSISPGSINHFPAIINSYYYESIFNKNKMVAAGFGIAAMRRRFGPVAGDVQLPLEQHRLHQPWGRHRRQCIQHAAWRQL
jgi:hypothetical protein